MGFFGVFFGILFAGVFLALLCAVLGLAGIVQELDRRLESLECAELFKGGDDLK